jgi:predicted  nucleic acid-binding Zn-ribbon protein
VDLLSRLSEVRAALLRYREETVAARNHLRLRRVRLTQRQALFVEDTRRLNALEGEGQFDRVTIDLLEDAVAGGRSAFETARRESTRAESAIRSLLLRLSRRIESLECDAETYRSRLSAIGASTYELLTRRHILPLVAYLADGRCSECRWAIPTPIVAAPSLKDGLPRCPNCSRVLLRREPGIPSLR